jgi:hypothetical protein
MKNYVHDGVALDLVAPYAVAAAAGFKVGQLIAIAAADAANAAAVVGYTQGVFDVLAEGAGSGQAWAGRPDLLGQYGQAVHEDVDQQHEGGSAGVLGRLRLVPGLAG